jgi:hypothetical protein
LEEGAFFDMINKKGAFLLEVFSGT